MNWWWGSGCLWTVGLVCDCCCCSAAGSAQADQRCSCSSSCHWMASSSFKVQVDNRCA